MNTVRPAPLIDRDSRPWWDALARHQLVAQRCADCSAWRFPPRAICNRCASFEWAWEPLSGDGEVVSWIVNHHGFTAAFATPYPVLTVRFSEQDDLTVIGSYHGELADLAIGRQVVAVYEDVLDEDGTPFTLLGWRLAEQASGLETTGTEMSMKRGKVR